MKKQYIVCHTHTAKKYTPEQKLKLSEFNLIREILKDHKRISIELKECSKEEYVKIFGY